MSVIEAIKAFSWGLRLFYQKIRLSLFISLFIISNPTIASAQLELGESQEVSQRVSSLGQKSSQSSNLTLSENESNGFVSNPLSFSSLTGAAGAKKRSNYKDSYLALKAGRSLKGGPGERCQRIGVNDLKENNKESYSEQSSMVDGLRERALKEGALSSSMELGFRWRYLKILEDLILPKEKILDELFDFKPLITALGPLYIAPPAAAALGSGYKLESPMAAISQEGSIKLISEAKIISLRPHWRFYLGRVPKEVKGAANPYLLPKSPKERAQWEHWVEMGWQLGLERAEELFIENLNSLVRDYLGALRYQRLVKEKRAREVKVIEVKKKEIVSQSEIVFNPTSYRLSDRGGLRSGAKERANENDLLIEK